MDSKMAKSAWFSGYSEDYSCTCPMKLWRRAESRLIFDRHSDDCREGLFWRKYEKSDKSELGWEKSDQVVFQVVWSCLTSQKWLENWSDHSEIWQTTSSFGSLFPVNGNEVVWFSYATEKTDRIKGLNICNPLSPIPMFYPMNPSASFHFSQKWD